MGFAKLYIEGMEFSTLKQLERGDCPDGLAWARLGAGPDLVILEGLTLVGASQGGLTLQGFAQTFEPFKTHFRVWLISLPPRLPEGASMADLANIYGDFLANNLSGGCHLGGMGFSGALALQVAADYPGLILSVGILSSGPRLSSWGRGQYERLFELARVGHYRKAHALMAQWMFRSWLGRVVGGGLALALSGDLGHPSDPWNFLVCLQAELSWDGAALASTMKAPLFWSAGARDPLYLWEDVENFRNSMSKLKTQKWVLHPKEGHGVYKIHSDDIHSQWLTFLTELVGSTDMLEPPSKGSKDN